MTTTAQGAAKVAQANALAQSGAVGGAVTSSGKLTTGGSANPKDLPGYVPGSSLDDKVGPITQMSNDIKASGQPIAPEAQLDPNAEAPQALVDQTKGLQTQVTDLAKQKGLTLKSTATGGYTAVPDLGAKMREGFNAATNSGVASPTGQGAGSYGVGQFTGNATKQESPSILGGLMETDKNFDSILTEYDDYFSPPKQKQSLVQEYEAMSKNLGLDSINAELINDKKIIEGTEDDIRNEVTAAGGFATDSQVQAMANARNKSLIKNYNYLLDAKTAATTQLNTMMQLSVQDRQFAEAEFDRKLNFSFKVAEFKQRAVDNARSTYMSLGDKMGWDTLLTSVSPYERGVIGKTLGMDDSAMLSLAQRSQEDRTLQLEDRTLDRKAKQASIDNSYSEISKRQAEIDSAQGTYGIDEKTMGKIQSSPEYKTINGVLPAIQDLVSYRQAIDDYGTTEQFNGQGKGTLKGTYGNSLASWKTLAGLGALSGADFGLAENAVPETGFFKRSSTSKAKLDASINNAVDKANLLTKRLIQNYPKAAPILQRQLDEVKVIAYPNKYKTDPETGEVIELTDVK